MISRIVLFILFQSVLFRCVLGQPTDPDRDQVVTWRNKIRIDNDELLQTLSELQRQPKTIAQLIPELDKLLKLSSEPARRLTFRCLNEVAEKASPATVSLIENLDHRDYWFRSEVMHVLKSIGPAAVPELKIALQSLSPRIRASALSTLNSMVTVDAALLEQLQNDPDSRVRIGVAQSWKKHGKQGVKNIVALLKDPESVVATGAAQSLQFHFEDSQLAVQHLSESLSRKDCAYSAALALQSFGVEAQMAIPQLIRSIPLGFPHDISLHRSEDRVSDVVMHIGPPRLEDLESLRQLLSDDNPKRRALAAQMLGRLGTKAESVASQLEELFQSSLHQHIENKKQASFIEDKWEREAFLSDHNVYEFLCLTTCTAYWRVSRNTERFSQLFEQLITDLEKIVSGYFIDLPFAEFSEQDHMYLRQMLQNPSVHVRKSVAYAVLFGVQNESLLMESLSNFRELGGLNGKILRFATKYKIQNARPQCLSWLIEDLNAKVLKLHDFAMAVGMLELPIPEVEMLLIQGLDSQDDSTRNACLRALAAISSDEQETARLLLSYAERDVAFRRTALDCLLKQSKVSELVIAFATECLTDADLWVRRNAISLLTRVGPPASESISELKKLSQNKVRSGEEGEDSETLLRLAIAMRSIAGDQSELTRRLDLATSQQTDTGRQDFGRIFSSFMVLGPDGDAFMDDIIRLMQFVSTHREDKQYDLESGLKLLAVVRSPRSIELLKTFRYDRNWQVRTRANLLLGMLDQGWEIKYDTFVR